MGQAWADCPDCGAHLKADRLEAHRKKAHAGPATRAIGSLRRHASWAVVVLLAVGAVAALVWFGQETAPGFATAEEPVAGSSDAPLTVYLFEDFQCSHCRDFEVGGGWDHFRTTWVDTGKVRVVHKDLAFLGDGSLLAAQASQAVWRQNPEGWHEWKRVVYQDQALQPGGWQRDALIETTRAWGQVDMQRFIADLDGAVWAKEVQGDVDEARHANVHSTPTLVVGTHRLNANDQAAVDAAIQEALDEVGAA